MRTIVPSVVFLKSFHYHHQANVSVYNSFELNSNTLNFQKPHRLQERHHKVVKTKVVNVLEADRVTPSVSALFFPFIIASKQVAILRL